MPPVETIARFIAMLIFGGYGAWALFAIWAITWASLAFRWELTAVVVLVILGTTMPCAFYFAWLFCPFTLSIS